MSSLAGPRKIAYVAYWNDSEDSGVYKKIVSQMASWRTLRQVEVRLFLLTSREDLCEYRAYRESFLFRRPSERVGAFSRLIHTLRHWSPDVIYLRFMRALPGFEGLRSVAPIVLEVNSDDRTESRKGVFQEWYREVSRKVVLGLADGIVFVSHQVAARPYYWKRGERRVVIGNSIDLRGFERKDPFADGLHWAFLGSPGQEWHGVDELLALARCEPEWTFHVFGYEESGLPGPIPSNVLVYGFRPAAEYLPIVSRCHLGVGCLALYRKAIDEISPLKVREYLALGLPVVQVGKDTDFMDGAPFILELPNDDRGVLESIGKIREFAERWRGKRVAAGEIRHLDSLSKERKRIEFVERVFREA